MLREFYSLVPQARIAKPYLARFQNDWATGAILQGFMKHKRKSGRDEGNLEPSTRKSRFVRGGAGHAAATHSGSTGPPQAGPSRIETAGENDENGQEEEEGSDDSEADSEDGDEDGDE